MSKNLYALESNQYHGILKRKTSTKYKEELFVLRSHFLFSYATKGGSLKKHNKVYNLFNCRLHPHYNSTKNETEAHLYFSTTSSVGPLYEFAIEFPSEADSSSSSSSSSSSCHKKLLILATYSEEQRDLWIQALKSVNCKVDSVVEYQPPVQSPLASFMENPASFSVEKLFSLRRSKSSGNKIKALKDISVNERHHPHPQSEASPPTLNIQRSESNNSLDPIDFTNNPYLSLSMERLRQLQGLPMLLPPVDNNSISLKHEHGTLQRQRSLQNIDYYIRLNQLLKENPSSPKSLELIHAMALN